jgi:hypothetical protein
MPLLQRLWLLPGRGGTEGKPSPRHDVGFLEATRGSSSRLSEEVMVPPPPKKRIQIEVLRMDGTYRFYPADEGWKVDTTYRLLIIGKGLKRYCIPLETIDYFGPREY